MPPRVVRRCKHCLTRSTRSIRKQRVGNVSQRIDGLGSPGYWRVVAVGGAGVGYHTETYFSFDGSHTQRAEQAVLADAPVYIGRTSILPIQTCQARLNRAIEVSWV